MNDPDPVTIDREHLEILLHNATRGDVANSCRRLRRGFRHGPVCSEPAGREPGCVSCQAFAAAESALGWRR